jgi:Trk K+ transport system NAD-binding subunit
VITTHDDDVNIYLAIYARRLRPDIQVIARANLDRNVSTLYRAGADAVLSYASTGAAAIWNRFRPDASLLLAEGLDVFRVAVPRALVGRSIAGTEIAEATGCQVVAVVDNDGRARRRSARGAPLRADAELILIGDAADQARFRRVFG